MQVVKYAFSQQKSGGGVNWLHWKNIATFPLR